MNKLLIIFGMLIFFQTSVKAQSTIIIQRGTTTLFATTLDDAIATSQNGDYIYLPGGTVPTVNYTQRITKKLKFFGAGYHPDSSAATGITQILGDFEFNSGSDSCFVTGITLTGSLNVRGPITGMAVTRCKLGGLYLNQLTGGLISENITGGILGNSTFCSNTVLQKNVVNGYVSSISGVTFSNNIFLLTTSTLLTSLNTMVFQNNVFLTPANYFYSAGSCSNMSYSNNLFVADSAAVISGIFSSSNNLFNQPFSSIFTTYTSGSSWTTSQNYHLKAGSAGKNKGTDGTDIGVYGSSSPFKEGGIPINPHYQAITIPSSTDANGKLTVKITVKAQSN